MYPWRFGSVYLLLLFAVFVFALLAILGVKGKLPAIHSGNGSAPAACMNVGCLNVGDHASFVLDGKVMAIDASQPGTRCIQIASNNHVGVYCARA